MPARFNSPPNWPPPPPGWTPPPGWQPDPDWGPPPDGWQLWVDENSQHPADVLPQQETRPGQHQKAWYKRWWAIAGAVILAFTVIANLIDGGSTETSSSANPATSSASESSSSAVAAPPPAPATTTSVAPPPPPPPPAPVLSPGQQNALSKAEDYLSFTAFSRIGLIEQLEFEGFENADATWAVDNLTVDWNVQAAEKAEEYLSFTSFSRQGLVDQLVFEGFTPAEAEYGASQAYDG